MGAETDPSSRRANLMVRGIDLHETRGRFSLFAASGFASTARRGPASVWAKLSTGSEVRCARPGAAERSARCSTMARAPSVIPSPGTTRNLEIDLDDPLPRIATAIDDAGGRALLVGRHLRDALLELPSKDIDLEAFGLPLDALDAVLGHFGMVTHVGRAFGVLRVNGIDVDYRARRRSDQPVPGHQGPAPVVELRNYQSFFPSEGG